MRRSTGRRPLGPVRASVSLAARERDARKRSGARGPRERRAGVWGSAPSKTMRLIRFGERGREKPGLQLADGTRVDASAFGGDYDEAFFENGGLDRLRAWAERSAAGAPRVP